MKGLTCLLSPSLQGDNSTWEPGKRVYTDKHSCCWRTWWLYVYVHSCREEEKERRWEIRVDSSYSSTLKANILSWILPPLKPSTNLIDFERHQDSSLGCFKPPQNCTCRCGTVCTKENVYKSCWKKTVHKAKDLIPRTGLWWGNRGTAKEAEMCSHTMCNLLFPRKSRRNALWLAAGERRWYIGNVCNSWDSVPKYHKNQG